MGAEQDSNIHPVYGFVGDDPEGFLQPDDLQSPGGIPLLCTGWNGWIELCTYAKQVWVEVAREEIARVTKKGDTASLHLATSDGGFYGPGTRSQME